MSSKENINNVNTKVTYTITAINPQGNEFTINYSDFYLQLSVYRMFKKMNEGTVRPQNSGTLTLNPSHSPENFTLTFMFPATTFNGMDYAATQYSLQYNGVGAPTLQYIQ